MVFFSKNQVKDNETIVKKLKFQNVLNLVYKGLIIVASSLIVFVLVYILYILVDYSLPLINKEGFSNIFADKFSTNNPQSFGLWRFIEGTLLTSFYALFIAIPLSIGISLFISQYVKDYRLKTSLKFLIELIAAIPSVLIGFWGIYVLGPALLDYHLIFTIPYVANVNIQFKLVEFLQSLHITIGSFTLGIPFITTPQYGGTGSSIFTATIALVIMIVPIVVSITVSIMDQVPVLQKEAALALGATPWEMSKMTVVPQSLRGIIGALTIGFGRALGETMAVTMLIGGIYSHPITSLFDSGSSITAFIASSWAENADIPLIRATLLELALILMIISLIVNLFARFLVSKSFSTGTGKMEG